MILRHKGPYLIDEKGYMDGIALSNVRKKLGGEFGGGLEKGGIVHRVLVICGEGERSEEDLLEHPLMQSSLTVY